MTLKVAIAQAAARSSTGTQDFTDASAGFSSDVNAAIFIGGITTANDTLTANLRCSIGFTGGASSNAALGIWAEDNIGASWTPVVRLQSADCYTAPYSGSVSDGEADWNAALSNGIQINWTDQANSPVSQLVSSVLLGGDVEMSCVQCNFTNAGAPESVNVTHTLGGAPEIIIALYNAKTTLPNSSQVISYGFYAGGVYAGRAAYVPTSTGSVAAGRVLTDCIAAVSDSAGAVTKKITLSAIGATTFTATSSSANDDILMFVCLRGTVTPITAKVGVHDTKTGSTGTQAMSLAMAAAPQVLLMLPSAHTAVDTSASDDSAGMFGFCASVNNAGAGTQYGGVAGAVDDGLNPSDANTQTFTNKALAITTVAGAYDVEATVSSWDAGDITLNYSNVGASAFKVPYLAFGIQAATKFMKLLTEASAASAASIEGVVLNAARDTVIGEFTGQAFEAALESGEAVLLIDVADIIPDGSTLTTSDTPIVFAYNATESIVGPGSATVIEV